MPCSRVRPLPEPTLTAVPTVPTSDFVQAAETLGAALRGIGLQVESLACFRQSRRHENWKVTLADGSTRLLRLALGDPGSLEREEAALNRMATCDLPVAAHYRRVDDVVGRPAAMSTWIDGSDGLGVMDAHPEALPELCKLMGRSQRVLEQQTRGRFGSEALDGRFVAVRPNWGSEYLAVLHDWIDSYRRAGLAIGPLEQVLIKRIHQAAPVLARVESFCLVHGDLRPANFVLELTRAEKKGEAPGLELVGLVDWEFARMADPLMGWALPLELPDEALAHVVDGYGREAVEALLSDDTALVRLDVYALGRAAQFLAQVVRHQYLRDRHWEHGLTHTSRLLGERLTPGFSKTKLTRVLELEELPTSVPVTDWRIPSHGVVWRALGRLSQRPLLSPADASSWMAAVACGLRHETHGDEGWARHGEDHLASLATGYTRAFEPIGDRRAWLTGLDRHVAALENDLAQTALWLGYRALGLVSGGRAPGSWMVSDSVLRGLQTLVEQLAASPVGSDPKHQLRAAALGLAAEEGLAALLERPLERDLQRGRVVRMREGWEDLTVFQGHVPQDVATFEPNTWAVPVLLLGGETLQKLPMKLGELVHALST